GSVWPHACGATSDAVHGNVGGDGTREDRSRMKWLVYLLAVVVFVLHQDWWNFPKAEPLAFGFLPIGLTYHAVYSVACAVLMWLFVRYAWPKHLEKYESLPPQPGADSHH